MHLFRKAWEHVTHHDPQRAIFGFDREADVNSARLVSGFVIRQDLHESSAARIGMALHYLYGAALGSGCALLNVDTWSPLVLGGTLWLTVDEVPITLAGISDPFRKSLTSHAGAFVAHYLFAAVLARANIDCSG
ncbi:MAG TPA: hypothetical protein VJR04_07815 [Terriglobales bacterium]|nr:hypothetical protein [Terriglobales bacterium]